MPHSTTESERERSTAESGSNLRVVFLLLTAALLVLLSFALSTADSGDNLPLRNEEKEAVKSIINRDLAAVEKSPALLDSMRDALIQEMWQQDMVIPAELPCHVENASEVASSDSWPLPPFSEIADSYRLTITDDTAGSEILFTSYSYYFRGRHPTSRRNQLLILHQGHGGLWANLTDDFATHLTVNGIDVLYLNMPLAGENTGPTATADMTLHANLCQHRHLGHYSRDGFNPLSILVNQIPVAIRKAEELNRRPFSEISMCGISGGGYITTLYAAIDTRIKNSFCVSGSMPHPLRNEGECAWEDDPAQSVFQICPMHLMYVLGVTGNPEIRRKQIQFYNCSDSVFPAEDRRFAVYRQSVETSAEKLGGYFSAEVDWYSSQHHITDWMQKKMLELLTSGGE